MSTPYIAVPRVSDVSRSSVEDSDRPRGGLIAPVRSEEHHTTSPRASSSDVMPEKARNISPTPRRHLLVWPLALVYFTLLIVPWVLTCVLSKRPFAWTSYFDQSLNLPANTEHMAKFWLNFIATANAICFLITVPLLSALLARGAAAYFERRAATGKITLAQTFVLADRVWTSPWGIVRAFMMKSTRTSYLFASVPIVLLAIIQIPLRTALVTTEAISIPTCLDGNLPYFGFTGTCPGKQFKEILAYDAQPSVLADLPRFAVLNQLSRRLSAIASREVQPYLWVERPTPSGTAFFDTADNHRSGSHSLWSVLLSQKIPRYWASSVPNTIRTGVLNEHALSLGSNVSCRSIDRTDFPSNCSGASPLAITYNSTGMSVRICVPGDDTRSPWQTTRDRQNISEELFIDLQQGVTSSTPNFTIRCSTSTTRQYFELPNDYNNSTAGGFVDTWSDYNSSAGMTYNDVARTGNDNGLQMNDTATSSFISQWGSDNFDSKRKPVPGPLMTTALALFGNGSFFANVAGITGTDLNKTDVAASLCLDNDMPFANLDPSRTSYQSYFSCRSILVASELGSTSDRFLTSWLNVFNNGSLDTTQVMQTAVFLANQVTLQQSVDLTILGQRRPIYTSPGLSIPKPSMSLPVMVVLSVLVVIEVVIVLALAIFVTLTKTLTATLDSLTMTRLGQQVSDGLAPAGAPQDWHLNAVLTRNISGEVTPVYVPRTRPRSKPFISASEGMYTAKRPMSTVSRVDEGTPF